MQLGGDIWTFQLYVHISVNHAAGKDIIIR